MTRWTHGVYIDEFTEYQTRDMPARQIMGAFVPSNGVGTGFRRDALDGLAALRSKPGVRPRVPDRGLRERTPAWIERRQAALLTASGARNGNAGAIPADAPNAIRQRTRWVTGIALQTWDRHGWSRWLRSEILAMARPQGNSWESREPADQRAFPLRSNSMADWSAAAGCPAYADGSRPGRIQDRIPDDLRRARVRRSICARNADSYLGGELYQLGGDSRGLAAILRRQMARATACMDQDRTRVPLPGRAGKPIQAGRTAHHERIPGAAPGRLGARNEAE